MEGEIGKVQKQKNKLDFSNSPIPQTEALYREGPAKMEGKGHTTMSERHEQQDSCKWIHSIIEMATSSKTPKFLSLDSDAIS